MATFPLHNLLRFKPKGYLKKLMKLKAMDYSYKENDFSSNSLRVVTGKQSLNNE